jgi:DNA polymerase-3 subunit delta'
MILKENSNSIFNELYDEDFFNYFIKSFPNLNRTNILFGNSLIYKLNTVKKIDEYLNTKNMKTELVIMDNNVSMDKIRYLINFVSLKSNDLKLIFLDLDILNVYSLNSILKTIEEPSSNVVFFLSKSNYFVLPTILSRASKFNVIPKTERIIDLLIKKYHFSLNMSEFIVFGLNNSLEDIDYFISNFTNISKKMKSSIEFNEDFYNLFRMFLNLKDYNINDFLDIAEMLYKKYESFLTFKVLIKFISLFFRDLFISFYNDYFKQKIFFKMIFKEWADHMVNFKIDNNSFLLKISEFLNKLVIFNNKQIYMKFNKKILYTFLILNVYEILRDFYYGNYNLLIN